MYPLQIPIIPRFAFPTKDAGTSPLHAAAHEGHPQLVELLLRSAASIDRRSTRGLSPLHLAASEGLGFSQEAKADRPRS